MAAAPAYHPQQQPPPPYLPAMHVRRNELVVRQRNHRQQQQRPPRSTTVFAGATPAAAASGADVRRPADATLLIEHMQVGLVIGRRGTMIRRIERETGCHVQVQKDHEVQDRSVAKRSVFIRAPLGVFGGRKKAMVGGCVEYISRMLAAQTVGKHEMSFRQYLASNAGARAAARHQEKCNERGFFHPADDGYRATVRQLHGDLGTIDTESRLDYEVLKAVSTQEVLRGGHASKAAAQTNSGSAAGGATPALSGAPQLGHLVKPLATLKLDDPRSRSHGSSEAGSPRTTLRRISSTSSAASGAGAASPAGAATRPPRRCHSLSALLRGDTTRRGSDGSDGPVLSPSASPAATRLTPGRRGSSTITWRAAAAGAETQTAAPLGRRISSNVTFRLPSDDLPSDADSPPLPLSAVNSGGSASSKGSRTLIGILRTSSAAAAIAEQQQDAAGDDDHGAPTPDVGGNALRRLQRELRRGSSIKIES